MSDATTQALQSLTAQIGKEVHVSDWLTVTQQRVNEFAQATGDHQWIHIDADRARRESPYGTTIAHGYLTLSLYPLLRGLIAANKPLLPGVRNVINYGLNKTRFPNAVRVGSKIRARIILLAVEAAGAGLQITEQYSVEIEGESKPACIAEAIMRLGF
jgi:acyl dehydratase